MKKRFIALILSICMILGIMPTQVFAEDTDEANEVKHIVFFTAEEGDIENMPDPQLVSDGQTASMPLSPYREGYTFLGWYTEPRAAAGEKMFDFSTPICEDIILYALWSDEDADMDGDGMPDGVEVQIGTDPYAADTDGDGLTDDVEWLCIGTDPLKPVSGDDGLLDGEADTDGDGISNLDEVKTGTNPANSDTDFDGLEDAEEADYGCDPMNPDSDGDGAADGLEVMYDTDPLVWNDRFTQTDSSQPYDADFPVSAQVEAKVSAAALGSVAINPLTRSDNPYLSRTMPGYIGHAFELSAAGEVYAAQLTFTYDVEAMPLSDTFMPCIYRFNEETQMLEELEEQTVSAGCVSAPINGCGTYILINKADYAIFTGETESLAFTVMSLSSSTAAVSDDPYVSYYANYIDELKAIAANGDTTDANNDGIADKYNIYIFLGLIPNTTGGMNFAGYDFGNSDDYDGDGLRNGDEIEIVIQNELPLIKVNSYPMLKDSDFDGLEDGTERQSVYNSDPMRHSYYDQYLEFLREDDNFGAALMVADLESSSFKDGVQDFATLFGYVQYGSLETILKREWLSYLMNYYDNNKGTVLIDAANKYEREYWIDTGMSFWEMSGKVVCEQIGELSGDLIEEAIETGSKEIIEKANEKIAVLTEQRNTAAVHYFHDLGEGWDLEGDKYASRLDNLVKTMSDCDVKIDALRVDIKYAEKVGSAVDITTTTVDILGVILDEAADLKEVLELTAQMAANLEAYASSREIFAEIWQKHPDDKVRRAAKELDQALASEENALRLNCAEVFESFGQVGVGIIVAALERALDLNPILSAVGGILLNITLERGHQNNIIIADDILCDAVEQLSKGALERVGNSYSPITQEEKTLTDRYLANLIQLRLLGEMRLNNFIHKEDTQSQHDSNVRIMTTYAAELSIPLSALLLLECAATVTPNVSIVGVGEKLDPMQAPPTGDAIDLYWEEIPDYQVNIDGFPINNVEGLQLTPGDHTLTVNASEIYGVSYKPCTYTLTIDETSDIRLTVELVRLNPSLCDVDGNVRIADLGTALENVTVTIRDGLGNKSDYVLATRITDEYGAYSLGLPNGYYTVEFSKPGYATVYKELIVRGWEVYKLDADLAAEYTITYDANGGTGAPAAHTNTVGATQLALNIPVFEDHTFLGWAENPDALAPTYGAGALLPAEKEGAITLYAVWQAEFIDIRYNYGDDPSGQNPTTEQDSFALSENDKYYVKPPKAGMESYNGDPFLGWMMENPDGDLWWADGQEDRGSYTLVQPNTFLQPIRDTELHAKWAWFLHYDYGNDLFIHDSAADGAEVVLPEPVHRKDGYAFYGWTVTGEAGYIGLYQPGETILPSSDLQLRADWIQRTFELDGTVCDQAGNPLADVIVETFDADGNSLGATLTDSAGSYTFHFTKAGTYKRVFHKIGYASQTVEGLVVDERISNLGRVELTEGISDLADGGRCGKQAAWGLDKNNNLYILGIGAMFDYEYYYDVSWRTYHNQVASITVGEGITRIGNYAFYNMDGTNGIQLTLPETLISISAYAFFGFHADENGRELDLPQRLETIGERAFETGSFTRIGIGRNVSQIGYRQTDAGALDDGSNPFGNNLVAIDVDPVNRNFASVDGVLYTKDLTALLAYPPARKSDTLILPETLTEIKSDAFKSMQAYNNLKHIGISAAMTDADTLHSAFDTRPIECFTVSSGNPEFCAVDGVIFSKDHKTLVLYPAGRPEPRYQVPAGTEIIGRNAFAGCVKLITLDLPRSLTTIESNAIYDCPLICHLVIPETMTTIESNAFRLYSNTTFDLYFKGDVPENFGWYVAEYNSEHPGTLYYARGAEGWTSPTWTDPNGGTTYATAPFNPETLDLSIIESGTLDNGLQWTVDQNGTLTISGSGPIEDMEYSDQQPWIKDVRSGLGMAIRKVIIEEGITSVGVYAFRSMENLKEVVIGDTVTSIGGLAFAGCTALTDVDLPDRLETIGNYVFADCIRLTSVVLPEGLQSIGGWAFENCTALTALELPDSVKTIGVGAFENCTSLTSMELPNGLESISQELFKGCANLKSVSIPDTVEQMGFYAFEGCRSLISIDLPIGIQYIGRSVFKDCNALTSVTLPDYLWQIQEYAFNGCTSLTSIIIPKSVNQIHEYAFSGAEQLNAIYFKGDVPRIMEAQALGSQRDAVIYYVAGTEGWTSPTWTTPDGGEFFRTATWKPRPVSAVQEISVPANDQRVIITMDEEAEDVTQVLVGVYDSDTDQFIGSAMGSYTAGNNTVMVTFEAPLPSSYELRVFCTDDNFTPLYKVSSFVK